MGMFDWLSPTAGADQGNMGLMGMLANPQTAGLLGMTGGLLQASGPSRLPVSNGMALGSGFQGMQQGIGNAMQNQRAMLTMQAMQGLLGGNSGTTGPQNSGPSGGPVAPSPAVTGSANTGALSGPMAGLGGFAPQPESAASSAQAEIPSAPTSQGVSIFGRTPQQLWQQGMAMNLAGIPGGADMMKIAVQYDPTLAYAMPTDQMKNVAAATGGPGTPGFANGMQGILAKDTTVPLRSGAPFIMNGKLMTTPAAAPPGFMNNYDNTIGQWSVMPIQGGTDAVKSSATAGSIGKAYGNNTAGYVNGQPAYVNQGALADRLTGGGLTPFQAAVRSVESGGRPDAVNPASGAVGSMQTMPTTATNPGFGVRPAQDNSPAELQRVGADYATAMQQKYGNDTDAAVAYNWGPQNADKWIAAGRPWNMLPKETQGYVGQVMTQMNNYRGQAMPTPELPPGAQTAANVSQGAPSKQMADAYGALSGADSAYQQSREALTSMIGLANRKGAGGAVVGVLPETVGTKISPDAAEYQKLHSTFVALQGKALGSSGTDAARATIDEAVPTYDKPQTAMVSGLNTQLNNLDLNHLKTQFLTPTYQAGNEKQYTQLSAAFDQNIKPSMMPVLQMSGDQQRAAVQAAVKANPALRPNFEWAFNHGMLK